MGSLPRLTVCRLLLVLAAFSAPALGQDGPPPESRDAAQTQLGEKGVTHVLVAWSDADRPLLDRIASRAPLHALWLAMGNPIHVDTELFFKYVRVAGARLPPETERARLALDRLDGPHLLGCDDLASEDCGLEAFDDLVLKEGEEIRGLAADSDFYYILARIESVGEERLELSLAAETFLGADRSAQPLPYGPVTYLTLRRAGEAEFAELRKKARDRVTLYRIADVAFGQRGR